MDDSQIPPHLSVCPEHQRIQKAVGTWTIQATYFWDPQNPTKNIAQETVAPLGQFWTVSRFKTMIMSRELIGQSTLGYDPSQKLWVSTWIDSFAPHLFHFTGNVDESGKVLTMTGKGLNHETGDLADYKTIETWTNDNEKTFDMFIDIPGKGEFRTMSYAYSRVV